MSNAYDHSRHDLNVLYDAYMEDCDNMMYWYLDRVCTSDLKDFILKCASLIPNEEKEETPSTTEDNLEDYLEDKMEIDENLDIRTFSLLQVYADRIEQLFTEPIYEQLFNRTKDHSNLLDWCVSGGDIKDGQNALMRDHLNSIVKFV